MSRGDKSSCARRGEAITTVIVWLLMGAIVNVAVAWGIALFLPMSPQNGYMHYDADTGVVTWLWTSDCRTYAIQGVGYGPGHYQSMDAYTERSEFHQLLPSGSLFTMGTPVLERMQREHVEVLSTINQRIIGWPLGSLTEVVFYDMQGATCTDTRTGSVMLPQFVHTIAPRTSDPPQSALPIRPIWPGFAINTVFYAAILWLLFAAPFALRQRLRIKRGLCPKCAYPVGASDVCTECGTELRSMR